MVTCLDYQLNYIFGILGSPTSDGLQCIVYEKVSLISEWERAVGMLYVSIYVWQAESYLQWLPLDQEFHGYESFQGLV